MKLRTLSLSLALALAGGAQAQSLMQVYEAARSYDAAYKSAQSQYNANLAKAEQAKAGLLPTARLASSVTENNADYMSKVYKPSHTGFGSQSATLSASYPLFNAANRATADQALEQVKLAQEVLRQAELDLMIRVTQAYVDVLNAQEAKAFVLAQKKAVAEQLAAAKRNFEVGTSTITDTREAQARYDLVIAQEIAADNDLRVKELALNQVTGLSNVQPQPLKTGATMNLASEQSVDTWVNQARERSPAIAQARLALAVAQMENSKASAARLPTLDAVASYAMTRYHSPLNTTSQADSNITAVGLNLILPLYTGGATENRIKEALALEEKARNDLEAAERNIAQATRTAYLGVQSGLGQVKALEAAESSSQSALEANQLGYQVGVRINIDVLNSQSQLFQTKRDLAKARYDVLMGQLKLRQTTGVLQLSDLQSFNQLLKP